MGDERYWMRFPISLGQHVDVVADRRMSPDDFDILLEYLAVAKRGAERRAVAASGETVPGGRP